MMPLALAREVVRCCRDLAMCSEQPGATTRTFLSAPMRDVHARLRAWMERLDMQVRIDHAGNIRGVHAASIPSAPRLFIGSHLDTVPDAGAFDGVLGVVLGIALVELLEGHRFPFDIEVIGFSEEEGVRFGVPFIGSRAFAGSLDPELLDRTDSAGQRVGDAISAYDLDPSRIHEARFTGQALGYLELHIEQGPVLESCDLALGIVGAIAGQNRLEVNFSGAAAHAGTTPMRSRRDALTGAAEWVVAVERIAAATPGLVATVGRLDVEPGASNVVPARCRASLDVRHANDAQRAEGVALLLARAREIAQDRGLDVSATPRLDQAAVPMDRGLAGILARGVTKAGLPVHRMDCGAGHDAMIVAASMPAAMLLLRSPGGISHHPAESVRDEDVAAALVVARHCLDEIARGAPWST